MSALLAAMTVLALQGAAAASGAAGDLGGWLHDLGPYVFRLPNGFGPRWYGLSYLAGFAIAWFALKRLSRRGLIAIPEHRVADAIMLVVLGVVLGGRLGYCLFYRPGLFLDFSSETVFGLDIPVWGVLKIWDGGMASHGGMLGVIVAGWRVSRGFKAQTETGEVVTEGRCPPLHVMDALALVAPFGLFLGRVANFINGELLGRVIAGPGERVTGLVRTIAVRYPQEHLDPGMAPELSTEQRFEMLGLLNDYTSPEATAGARYERLLELLRTGDPATRADIAQRLEPLVSARLPSQLVQALAEGVIVGAVVWFVARVPRKPGVVAAWFLISYGVLRIATELVRLPDAHLSTARPLGLTRGQWLSAAMIVAGAALLWKAGRSGGARYLGWLGSGGRDSFSRGVQAGE